MNRKEKRVSASPSGPHQKNVTFRGRRVVSEAGSAGRWRPAGGQGSGYTGPGCEIGT